MSLDELSNAERIQQYHEIETALVQEINKADEPPRRQELIQRVADSLGHYVGDVDIALLRLDIQEEIPSGRVSLPSANA